MHLPLHVRNNLIFITLFFSIRIAQCWLDNEKQCNCNPLNELTKNALGFKSIKRIYNGDLQFTAFIYSRQVKSPTHRGLIDACRGVLLNSFWSVTTATCVEGIRENHRRHPNMLEDFIAVGGELNLHKILYNEANDKAIKTYHVYPKFISSNSNNGTSNNSRFYDDLALVEVETAFELGPKSNIYAACWNPLWQYESQIPDLKFFLASYEIDLFVSVMTQNRKICDFFTSDIENKENIICLSSESLNQLNICGGDSGGPVLVEHNKKLSLIGIIRMGKMDPRKICSEKTIYVQLITKEHFDWINLVTNNDLCMPDPLLTSNVINRTMSLPMEKNDLFQSLVLYQILSIVILTLLIILNLIIRTKKK